MRKVFVGTVDEKDGMLALRIANAPQCWYPLGGSSGLAQEFREAFGAPQRGDMGKRVWRVGDVLQMENDAQRREREESGK